jgi:hypothetical protein
MLPRAMLSLNAPFQGLFFALGQLQELAHLEIGGGELEWSAEGMRQENWGCGGSLVQAVASSSMTSLSVTQSHVFDSAVVSNSTHIQHAQRLLQV